MYRLVTDKWVGYFTGHAGDKQVLLGFHVPGLLAVLFDRKGTLTEVRDVAFSEDLLDEWSEPPYDPKNPARELRPQGFHQLRKLMGELQFAEGPIAIQPFSLEPAHFVGLDEVPGEIRDILCSPEGYEAEERAEAEEYLRQSTAHGGPFGFWWDQEYVMNPDGTINTT